MFETTAVWFPGLVPCIESDRAAEGYRGSLQGMKVIEYGMHRLKKTEEEGGVVVAA